MRTKARPLDSIGGVNSFDDLVLRFAGSFPAWVVGVAQDRDDNGLAAASDEVSTERVDLRKRAGLGEELAFHRRLGKPAGEASVNPGDRQRGAESFAPGLARRVGKQSGSGAWRNQVLRRHSGAIEEEEIAGVDSCLDEKLANDPCSGGDRSVVEDGFAEVAEQQFGMEVLTDLVNDDPVLLQWGRQVGRQELLIGLDGWRGGGSRHVACGGER